MAVSCKTKVPSRELQELPTIWDFNFDNKSQADVLKKNLKGNVKSKTHYEIDINSNHKKFYKSEIFNESGYFSSYHYANNKAF